MNSTTVLTLHNKESASITELLGALAEAGFTVVTAAPEDIRVSFACLLQDVSTILVDYPKETLLEVLRTFKVCHKGVPVVWLSETLEEDCVLELEGVEVTCIKLPLQTSVLLRVVEWLSKSFSAYQQVVRVGMSIETLRASGFGGRHGN